MGAQVVNLSKIEALPPLWTIILVGFCLAQVGLSIYRLWFHPLARFPGPRLAAATQWYEAYYEFIHNGGASFTPRIRQLHQKYGPIVRIGPNEISVDDAEFHDKLYCPQPALRDRHPHFSSSLGTTKGSFSTVEHHAHRNRRMAYTGFFSSPNVMAAEPMMKQQVETLCELIQSNEGQRLDLKTLFAALSFDTFYTWAFGSSLKLFEDLSLAAYCNETVETLVTGPAALVVRIFPTVIIWARSIPHWILRGVSRRMAQVFDLHAMIAKAANDFVAHHGYVNEGYEKTSSVSDSPAQSETLFAVIRRSKAPVEEKEASRMAQEGTEMFMASFTPGRTLLSAMYYLHSRPSVLENLRQELDMANPDPNMIPSLRTLDSLPYLRAVMKEILRITFPVGSRLPLIAHEGLVYGKWTIPPGTPTSVNHRNLLFDPDVFSEPEKFKPERWLDPETPINEKRYNIPFGKGGRGCPGKEFATDLIQLCLVTVVQRFEFNLVNTAWERDVLVKRESLLTAPSLASKGVEFHLVGRREVQA